MPAQSASLFALSNSFPSLPILFDNSGAARVPESETNRMTVAGELRAWASVSCRGNVREIEDGFRERKFQHDLTLVVGHFEHCIKKGALGTVGLQQFPDHGSRGFPGARCTEPFFSFRE